MDINPSDMFWRTGLIYDETTGVRCWIHPRLPDWNMPEEYKPEKYLFKYAKDGDGMTSYMQGHAYPDTCKWNCVY